MDLKKAETKLDSLKDTLMQRDGITAEEADEQIEGAKEHLMALLAEGDISSAMDVCEEEFGLEPDYLFDLL